MLQLYLCKTKCKRGNTQRFLIEIDFIIVCINFKKKTVKKQRRKLIKVFEYNIGFSKVE